MSLRPAQLLLFIVGLVVMGIGYLGLRVAWAAAIGAEVPNHGIGKWMLLAIAIGLSAAFTELVLFPRVIGADKVTDPLWRRGLRLSVMLGVVALFCVAFWGIETL